MDVLDFPSIPRFVFFVEPLRMNNITQAFEKVIHIQRLMWEAWITLHAIRHKGHTGEKMECKDVVATKADFLTAVDMPSIQQPVVCERAKKEHER
jgi:hypothetical protein